jgi:hypothetical protein
MSRQFVLVPNGRREIPLGHTIIGRSPDPSDVVEFDPPSSDSHPIPEPLDYPKVLEPDSKMLESIAFHAGGNEERFIKLCHRCNVTPSWWTEDGYGKVYYSFKSTSYSFNDLIKALESLRPIGY